MGQGQPVREWFENFRFTLSEQLFHNVELVRSVGTWSVRQSVGGHWIGSRAPCLTHRRSIIPRPTIYAHFIYAHPLCPVYRIYMYQSECDEYPTTRIPNSSVRPSVRHKKAGLQYLGNRESYHKTSGGKTTGEKI